MEIKDSLVEICNGKWLVVGLSHYLESEVSGGRWLSEVDAIYPGGVKIVK